MQAGNISVTDPIAPAWARTRRALFEPFEPRTWFTLGFCAFLARLGDGSRSSIRLPGNALRQTGSPDLPALGAWASEHVLLLVLVGCCVLVVSLTLGLLFLWLSSRGKYMFLDCVVRGVAEVQAPWRRFRSLGNSFTVLRFLLGVAGLFAVLASAGLGLVISLPSLRSRTFEPSAFAGIVVGGGLAMLVVLALVVALFLLNEFALPLSYRRGIPVAQALQALRRELLPGNGGAIARYFLMKLVLGLGAAVLMVFGACITCCLAALPYLSSVAFLPIFVFFQNYTLGFLAQFGAEWDLLTAPPGVTVPEPPLS